MSHFRSDPDVAFVAAGDVPPEGVDLLGSTSPDDADPLGDDFDLL